jgi:hypothetical protein
MTRVSVEVPAELTRPVRETVLLLYQATAESLHQALRSGDDGEAHAHRVRIDQLDELARSLADPAERAPGAAGDRGPRGPVLVTASRDLLHDTLYGALIDAGERLADISGRGWRGELPAERIQEAAAEVLGLHALLSEL